MKLAARCKRCTISEYATPLLDGECADCKAYVAKTTTSDLGYRVPFGNERTAVLLSGGKDSIYTLARMRAVGRRIDLAIFVDNGFSSRQAIENCRQACDRWNVDFAHVRHAIPIFRRVLRRAFLRMADEGLTAYEVVDYSDGSTIFDVGRRFANEHHIWNVVCGLSSDQVELIAGHDQEIVEDDKGRLICPLVRWKPSVAEIVRTISDSTKMKPWQFQGHRTNNSLIPVMCAIDIICHGFCSFEWEFARGVRKGEMDYKATRNLWEFLEWSASNGWMNGTIRRGLASLGLSSQKVLSGDRQESVSSPR